MIPKTKLDNFKRLIRRLVNKFMQFPWGHFIVIIFCFSVSWLVFYLLKLDCFMTLDTKSILTNLLTVHGVFSAILMTYLFSRITWSKERKLEVFREAVTLSQKLTEYRKILNKLTNYYDVWQDDKSAKSLIDHGKFKNIDFYDYKLSVISDYEPENKKLIKELLEHKEFQEGQSILYLSMVSLVRNRSNPNNEIQEELFKDFEHKGLYKIQVIEKWIECEIFGSISFWLNKNNQYINFTSLRNDEEYILTAASRINKKYAGYAFENKLLKELSEDFSEHYLQELYFRLKELKKGLTGLNSLIIILISTSLIFGVLIPFILLLTQFNNFWISILVAILASINAGLFSYFIIRFPILINKELQWV